MMKSDYKSALLGLTVMMGIGGAWWAVDTFVSLPERQDEQVQNIKKQPTPRYYSDFKPTEQHLQRFDPNTADSTTLLNLGLPPFIVRGMYKYRAMGGVYSSAEDFARIPGLTQKLFKQLKPYIYISDDYKPAALLVGDRRSGERRELILQAQQTNGERKEGVVYQQKMKPTERLSLNTADTTALKTVPGIGSYFAKKIVELRTRYGGFNSLDQLLEIKNFPESALEYLTIPDGGITKLNINRATFQQLAAHPYIGYSRTKSIVNYRKLKGRITSLNQLSLLPGFSDEEIARMEPFVEY